MNILIVSPDLPYPKHQNGTTSTLYNLITEWRQENTLSFCYFGAKNEPAEQFCRNYRIRVFHRELVGGSNEYLAPLGGRTIVKSRNAFGFKFANCEAIPVDGYDLVFLAGFASVFMYEHLQPQAGGVKIVFFEGDSLALYYERCSRESHILERLYYYIQAKLVKEIERRSYALVDRVLYVSDVDRAYAVKNFPAVAQSKFQSVRIGVEQRAESREQPTTAKLGINVGFSGILDYLPNAKAVEFIMAEIADRLLTGDFRVRLHIIGKNPPENLQRYVATYQDQLQAPGFVPDLNQYLAGLDLYISPLFIGTGMKNKILQAMSLGVPIICTTISAEGITELRDGRNCLICDSPNGADWVEKIIGLINNPGLREQFSRATQVIIKENYSWEKVAREMMAGF
jgi:glycosyltransferase involved in cell wall biosynthesis